MDMSMPSSAATGDAVRLVDRASERAVLERLLEGVRGGESQALVLAGEPGIGKTALLEHMVERAADCRVISVSGVQSEMELAFAALQQVCAPLLDRLSAVPVPQAEALRITFGLASGPVPDRLLVGLAVLSLLAETAAEQPLLCVVDDEQWLDRASAQLIAFVARRLGAESIGLVFGTRAPSDELTGLPQLTIEGLGKADACALLDSVLTIKIEQRIRDQLVAETDGNPLALVELPRELAVAELAGGFGLPGAVTVPGNAEEMFRRRVEALPAGSRRLLLLAAADPTGDPVLLWRAAAQFGIGAPAARPAVAAGLAEFGARVRFRHPLARSAVYQSASAGERQEAHAALADATDPALDPDCRAWHRAEAAEGPDEDVAGELERSASRAQARGGVTAAAAFLERATLLTPDPAQRTRRAIAGAQAKVQAGDSEAARELLAIAEAGLPDAADQARAELVQAQLAVLVSWGGDVSARLLEVAKRLEPIDADLTRMTYLDAIYAAVFAGRFAAPGADVAAAAQAAVDGLPPPGTLGEAGRILGSLRANFSQVCGPLPKLVSVMRKVGCAPDREIRWLTLATIVAIGAWDDQWWAELADRQLELCRREGSVTRLMSSLSSRMYLLLHRGELAAATSVVGELQAASQAIRNDLARAQYGMLALAAFRGRADEASALLTATLRGAAQRGEGAGITMGEWASAVLNNGRGHYQAALAAARRATEYTEDLSWRNWSLWALAELVEAAVRSGETESAETAYGQLTQTTTGSGTDWGLGVQARSRALLAAGTEADDLYREAIERLGRTSFRAELARAHLLYGEWLRRERRRGEARTELRTAHGMLEAMGMAAFAERARRELWATGETARKRSVAGPGKLTAQELQIAKLARDGLTNPEIGTRLFISARTVEYHLGKVFTKLGITSRAQLDDGLR
jgi:DNA-binding CsgD family transcriptional regulator